MNMNTLWQLIIYNKGMLYFLLVCNLLGTIYGYIWYGSQISITQWQFIPFVPDSPTASLFLCIAIAGLIIIFYPRFKVTIVAFFIAMVWVFHNDIIDYVFMQYPYYDFIASHVESIAYLAFWLSITPLVLYLSLTRFKKDKIFDHY